MKNKLALKFSQQQLNFLTPHQQANLYCNHFLSTELGKIYLLMPWAALYKVFGRKKE